MKTKTKLKYTAGKKPIKEKAPMANASLFLMVGQMQPDQQVVNWSKHDVMTATGKRRQNQQGGYEEVELISKHDGGEVIGEWWVPAHYPVLDDPMMAAAILKKHEALAKIINGRDIGGKARAVQEEVEVVDPTTGEVTIELKTKAKKAQGRPRGNLNARTGCGEGTSGHAVGLIVLRQKPKGFDRGRAIAAAMKELQMDKGLASSWVSTLIRRKAPFVAYDSNGGSLT